MERRAFERINTSLPVKYTCDDILYAGTIENISEKGMFISTGNFLPCIKTLEVLIPLEKEISKFAVKIRRIERTDPSHFIMGVEVQDPPDNYIEFVKALKIVKLPF